MVCEVDDEIVPVVGNAADLDEGASWMVHFLPKRREAAFVARRAPVAASGGYDERYSRIVS